MEKAKNETWNLDQLKLVLRFVNRDFSRYTMFLPLFKFSKSFLKLENRFSRYLGLNYRSQRYEVSKIANLVVSLISCGIDRFVRLDDEFKVERGLAKALGFPSGFPTSDTLYRFFRSFNGWNINQLEKINLELLKEQKNNWFPKTGSVFVDFDMNTKSLEGKQFEKAALGYNRKRPGRLSLSWTIAHISKVAFYSELDSGKASGRTVFQRQVEHVESMLEKIGISNNAVRKRIVWRIDGGYFSWENLRFLNGKNNRGNNSDNNSNKNNSEKKKTGKRKFLTRLPNNLKVLQPYLNPDVNYDNQQNQNKNQQQLKWKKYSRSCEYMDIGLVFFPELKCKLKMVILRVIKDNDILIYPLCTSITEWTAKNIVKAYRGRQIIEDYFRDTNQAFCSNKLPSSSFYGNSAFLWFIVLASNLFFFFQRGDRTSQTEKNDPQETFSKIPETGRRAKTRKRRINIGDFA